MTKHKTIPAKLFDNKSLVHRTTVALRGGHPPAAFFYRGLRFAFLSIQGGVAIYKREGASK